MKYRKSLVFLFLFCSTTLFAQTDTLRIMSYNVENLFDTKHDSLKNDQAFTPEGSYRWTITKYRKKLGQIARVIASVGEWNIPTLVALCEIENANTLRNLTTYSPLRKYQYQYMHKESPDKRGIDVALLYKSNKFKLISTEFIPVRYPNSTKTTRDILYASGLLKNQDTLHIFVAHFPSRLGGQAASEPNRIRVASLIRKKVDSLFRKNPHANIIIMGDFNDYPKNKSLTNALKAYDADKPTNFNNTLYNLFYHYTEKNGIGSHKYGEWGMLDHILVSGNLLSQKNRTHAIKGSEKVYHAPFLLEKDEKLSETQPFRTHIGMKYHGGYSDHLPVFFDLAVSKP